MGKIIKLSKPCKDEPKAYIIECFKSSNKLSFIDLLCTFNIS